MVTAIERFTDALMQLASVFRKLADAFETACIRLYIFGQSAFPVSPEMQAARDFHEDPDGDVDEILAIEEFFGVTHEE